MEISTPIGIVLTFAALIIAFVLDEGNPAGLLRPTAAMIVFGGTFGAAFTAFPLATVLKIPKMIMLSVMPPKMDFDGTIATFVQLADKARREGLLSLEEEAQKITDPFLKRGVMLVVDGVDAEVVREILESEITNMEKRHKSSYAVLSAMGGFSPTMGVVGTVMGLTLVLSTMAEDPGGIGEKIGTAFVATLYGVGFANALWLPIASKLKGISEREVALREMMTEGVLAVQAGENPRIVREKLETFIPPKLRGAAEAAGGATAGASARAQA
ncbi:MAG: flagellar motor protein [Anaerolineae bacterium]